MAKVMEGIEDEVELTNKVDQLHEKLDGIKEEIMDHYNDKIYEVGSHILDKIDATSEHVGLPPLPKMLTRASLQLSLPTRRSSLTNSPGLIALQNSLVNKIG